MNEEFSALVDTHIISPAPGSSGRTYWIEMRDPGFAVPQTLEELEAAIARDEVASLGDLAEDWMEQRLNAQKKGLWIR